MAPAQHFVPVEGRLGELAMPFPLCSFRGDEGAIHEWADTLARDANLAFLHADIPG